MYKMIFDSGLQINNTDRFGTVYLSSDEVSHEQYENVYFKQIDVFDIDTGDLVYTLENKICDKLDLSDDEEEKYNVSFTFHTPTESEWSNIKLNEMTSQLINTESDTTEIQEAIADMYEMILSMM